MTMIGLLMARPSGPKTRCNGEWTEARFTSFIRSILRQGTRKWAPITSTMKEGNIRRGVYLCNGCKKEVPLTYKEGRKKIQNVFVDHIRPITDPETGFTSWDDIINNMFCEKDNLQILCLACHTTKTNKEREAAAISRAARKEENND